jgi:hypothetical protein
VLIFSDIGGERGPIVVHIVTECNAQQLRRVPNSGS